VTDAECGTCRKSERCDSTISRAAAVVSHASFRIVRVGVPIQILGVEIKPGDLFARR